MRQENPVTGVATTVHTHHARLSVEEVRVLAAGPLIACLKPAIRARGGAQMHTHLSGAP